MNTNPKHIFAVRCLVGFVLTFLLASCSVTKYVPDGQYLLDQTTIQTSAPNMNSQELESYLTQRPNFRVFGMSRLRLLTYSLSGRDTTKRRNRWLRRMGEPPVLYDEFQKARSEKRLEQFFKTKGYLNAQVRDSVVLKDKKARVFYLVTENEPYRIRNIIYDYHNDTVIGNLVKHNRFSTTKLVSGSLFDTDVLDEERERVTGIVRRNGYYYFTKDDVSYLADSALRSHEVDLTLLVKPYHTPTLDGISQETNHPRFTIRNVNVLTLPRSTSSVRNHSDYDSLSINDNIFVFYEKKPLVRKKVLANSLRIVPGMWYNSFFVNQTYTRLSGLGIVRSAEISFSDPKTGDNQLDCNVVLVPNKPHSFSLDLEGTNSSGDLGFAVTGMLQHKNLFRGSELLSLKGRFAEEAVTNNSKEFTDMLKKRVKEYEGELSLKLPQFVFPFLSNSFRRRVNSTTEFTLAYNDQERPEYTRKILTAGGKYNWVARRFYNMTIDAFNLNYVYLPWISDAFNMRYADPKYSVLRESYSDHLILATGFTMAYNNQASKLRLNKKSYRFSYESAGNLLYGLARIFDFKKENDTYVVGDIPFSQYQKAEFEYAYNRFIDDKNRVVFHAKIGGEYPYLNANTVPFEKKFFGGGANGVRGWSVRTLGPGSYEPENPEDFVSQSGNLELTLNAEYRSKLFWLFEGAAFVDAGNIWNLRDYKFQHEGTFYIDKFYKQIALAYGLGLRCDFTYFLIRFDLGMKAYDPALSGTNRWRYRNITWHDDFAFHFAIGYPF